MILSMLIDLRDCCTWPNSRRNEGSCRYSSRGSGWLPTFWLIWIFQVRLLRSLHIILLGFSVSYKVVETWCKDSIRIEWRKWSSFLRLVTRYIVSSIDAYNKIKILYKLVFHGAVWLTFVNMLTFGAYSVSGKISLLICQPKSDSKCCWSLFSPFIILSWAHSVWLFNSLEMVFLILLNASILFIDFGGFIAQQLEEQLVHWIWAAKLTCDMAALIVARDSKVDSIEIVAFSWFESKYYSLIIFSLPHKRWSFPFWWN